MPVNLSDNYILGISAHYHDSSATLLKNGVIFGAVQEERFTRKKGDSSFPIRSITYLLNEAKIEPHMLEAVVYYESPYLKFNRLLSTLLLGRLKSLPLFNKAMLTWLNEKLWVEKEIKRLLGKKIKVVLLDHHLSHASSAFYPSPFSEAGVLTIDGVGEWSTTTISHGVASKLEMLEEIQFPNSLGLLYSAFTHYCGFKINSGEYKLMGLAPFGDPTFVDTIKENLINLNSDGSYALNPKYFSFDKEERTYNQAFIDLFGVEARDPNTPVRAIDQDLAASIQQVLNEAVLNLAKRVKELTKSEYLTLAGGVALNVVSMGELERSKIFTDIWIQPASGDAGGSLGAALYYYYQNKNNLRVVEGGDSMQGAFLGPYPGEDRELEELLKTYQLSYETLSQEELVIAVSHQLQIGNVVGVAKGRAEFGPRALGARSILADAREPAMQSNLNLKIKFREGFRPFAPLLLERFLPTYFTTQSIASPFMLKTYNFKDQYRLTPQTQSLDLMERVKALRSPWPAITHLDYSARVQTVDSVRHPFLSAVMENFYLATDSPFLVNTSFNVRGEPIVNTGEEALECFLATNIDALVLNNYFITKKANPGISARHARDFGAD